MKHLRAVIS